MNTKWGVFVLQPEYKDEYDLSSGENITLLDTKIRKVDRQEALYEANMQYPLDEFILLEVYVND